MKQSTAQSFECAFCHETKTEQLYYEDDKLICANCRHWILVQWDHGFCDICRKRMMTRIGASMVTVYEYRSNIYTDYHRISTQTVCATCRTKETGCLKEG